MRKSEKNQKLRDDANLLRAWKRWHAEQLEDALAGVHAEVLGRLMAELKQLRSARELVNAVSAEDWSAIDDDTRLIALHEIDTAIMRLRERMGMPPIDDALPGAPSNAFQIIRSVLCNGEARRSRFGNQSMETSDDE